MAREMIDGLFDPGFDGDTLRVCGFGLMRAIEYIERTSKPTTSAKSKARRLSKIVRSGGGFKQEMIRTLNRLASDRLYECVGEQRVVATHVLEHLLTAHERYGWMVSGCTYEQLDAGQARMQRVVGEIAAVVLAH